MKPLRIALAIFFSLLLVFLVTAAVIFLRTDPAKIFTMFSEQIAKSVFLQLKAQDVKLDLLKGIELSNVQVIDVQDAKSNTLATFERGTILYNPFSLLWSSIDILKASVSGIHTTFDDLLRTVSNINEIVVRSSNQNAPVGVVIRSIAVEDSELVFNGALFHVRGGILFAELLGDSVINADLDSKLGSIGVKGNLNKMSVTLEALQLGKIIGITDTIVLDSVRGKIVKESDSVFRFSGSDAGVTYLTFKGQTVTPFSGKFDFAKNEIVLGGFDVKTGKSLFHLDELRSSFIKPELTISLSGISADLSDLAPDFAGFLGGNLTVNAETAVTIGGELSLSNLSYSFIKQTGGTVRIESNGVIADLAGKLAGGEFSATLACADLFGAPVDVKVSQDVLDADKIAASFSRKTAVEETPTNAAVSFTNAVRISYSLGGINYQKLRTGKAEIRASVSGRGVRLDDAKIDFLKGALSVKGFYADDTFSGDAVLTEGKLKEFTVLFLDSGKKLFGTVSAKAKFGINLKDPVLSEGDIGVAVKDGEIKGVFIQNRISAVLFDIPLDDIFFDSIVLNGKMENGVLNVNAFSFDSENIRLSASGQVRLKASDLSLKTEISFTKDYLSGLPNVAQIFTSGYEKDERVSFGMSVTGPIKNPAVKIEKTK